MKVAIYARVSKEETGLQDPDNQIIPLKAYCDGMKWTVTQVFIDKCSGGNSNRPAFQEMLYKVRQKKFDIIMVWALDRFSREGISQTLGYITILKHHNTALKSYQESWLDTSVPGIGEVLLSIMAWVAAEERRRISERTKAALHKLKLKGVKLGRPRKKVPPVSI